VGSGFIKDDFRWILSSRITDFQEVTRLFTKTTGFYRPLVSLSFTVNDRVAGTRPKIYGLTNAALAASAALALAWLAHIWRLPRGASIFAAAVWLLNPHGINMALLWISGRTALMLSLFAILAAVASSLARPRTAVVLFFLALLSKEEAILLPIPLIAILYATRRCRTRDYVVAIVGFCIAAAVYAILRQQSDAMTPATAPSFYKLTFEPRLVLRNVAEYANRSLTFIVAVLCVWWAIVRRKPSIDRRERALIAVGLLWLVCGFGITIFLPVRSSLYACLPSAGAALSAAVVATALWRLASVRRQLVAAVAALIIPVLLIPIYKQRNHRWVDLALLTSNVRRELELASAAATDGHILIVDDRTTRVSILNAFGFIVPDAVELFSGQRRTVLIVPPPTDASPSELYVVPSGVVSVWELIDGRLQRRDVRRWIGANALALH
jgi:hypothetical protein